MTIVMGERCNWCGKFRAPNSVHRLKSHQAICDECLEWHAAAMDVLAGKPPAGCQECGKTWQHLREHAAPAPPKMTIVEKDGIYQLLCEPCAEQYVGKRADFFGNTPFWVQRKAA